MFTPVVVMSGEMLPIHVKRKKRRECNKRALYISIFYFQFNIECERIRMKIK